MEEANTTKLKKGLNLGPVSTAVELDNGAVVVDEAKVSEVDSAASGHFSDTDALKGPDGYKKPPQGWYQRHRQRMRDSRRWCAGTWCLLALVVTILLLAIILPIVYCVIIPSVANSSVSKSKLLIAHVALGHEDLARSTIDTTMVGSVTGMPSFRVRTGAAEAVLSNDDDGTMFATTDLPVLEGWGGTIALNMHALMRISNRTAFDEIARAMINRGMPGKIRMRARKVPVTVWLGAIKLGVYGGVNIDQLVVMDAITGLNQVNVSDAVRLLSGTDSELAIGMGVALNNPSTTTVLAENGIVLDLMTITNKTLGRVELAPFQLRQGENQVMAKAIIQYTNPVAAGIMRRGGMRRHAADNTLDVREFLTSYTGGKPSVLRLRGPDSNSMPDATYVQRALANWTTTIELAAQASTNFVTATTVKDVKPFQEFGKIIVEAEVAAANPFDLPVTVRNVSIAIFMRGERVGAIDYDSGQVIPAKGNVTLSGLSTTIDIGPFLGNIISDAFDWVGSMITGNGPIGVGDVSLAGHIDVRVEGHFPIFLPIKSQDVPLANLTNPNALQPSG